MHAQIPKHQLQEQNIQMITIIITSSSSNIIITDLLPLRQKSSMHLMNLCAPAVAAHRLDPP